MVDISIIFMGFINHYKPTYNWGTQALLVGGAITILKNMKVNGKVDIPYLIWKKHQSDSDINYNK